MLFTIQKSSFLDSQAGKKPGEYSRNGGRTYAEGRLLIFVCFDVLGFQVEVRPDEFNGLRSNFAQNYIKEKVIFASL